MEKNINTKQIFVIAGITLGLIVAFTVLLTLSLTRNKATETVSGDDMASHHAPPSPANDSLFKSLLGQTAPDFSLESYNGEKVSLSALKGKKVILFFSEGAMCYPGCWDQVSAFASGVKDFADKNAVVYTVIVDPRQDWKEAVDKEPKMASANVLIDSGGQVSSKYGALTVTSSMHRGQFPGHTYVIVDAEGIVRYLFDDESMLVRNKELLVELNKI